MARARTQPVNSLVGLISDEMDETMSDEILGEAPDSNQENFAPARSNSQKSRAATTNPRARQAVTKKPAMPRARTTTTTTTRKPAKRETIEQDDLEDADDIDELEDVEVEAEPEPEPQKHIRRLVHKAKAASIDRRTQSAVPDESTQYRASVRQSPRKAARVNGTSHPQPQPFHALQSDGIDAVADEADFMIEELAQPVIYQSVPQLQARSTSQQPGPVILNRQRRAGSTSSTEGKNPDPALRRKLGELTKKFEALEIRYRKLHDVGIVDAKTNFDKLKAASDDKARTSTQLIDSLKKEIAAQKSFTQQAQAQISEADKQKDVLAEARAQLAAAKKEIAELKTERTELKKDLSDARTELKSHSTTAKALSDSKSQIATLTKQLSEAQIEHTNLQSRLTAARQASTDRQIPGSAMKGSKVPVMKVMTTTAEAAAAIADAQSKVDLYADLTGLLISRVERRTAEHVDVFDCIQTGRNGTLHFKLSVSTDTTESYDDAEFGYLPQLDRARDGALMELLPYYLIEDIQFSRQEAAKFYSRVFEMLTRKLEDEDEGGDEGSVD